MPSPQQRKPLPPWLRPLADRLSPTIKVLVMVFTLAFLLYVLAEPVRPFVDEYLALGPNALTRYPWQPLTAIFFHLQFLGWGFSVLGIWFVGAGMEQVLGRRRFLMLFFLPALLGHVAHAAVALALAMPMITGGCGLGVLALFVGFGVHYGRTPARVLGGLVVEARMLALVLIGFSIVVELLSRAWASLAGSLTAVAVSYVIAAGGVRTLIGRARSSKKPRRSGSWQVLQGGRSGKTGKDRPYVN
jgi:membrane associated rhomboid family serine protease